MKIANSDMKQNGNDKSRRVTKKRIIKKEREEKLPNSKDAECRNTNWERELVRRVRMCHGGDSIFDFIDPKFKTYLLRKAGDEDNRYDGCFEGNTCHMCDQRGTHDRSSWCISFESVNAYELKKHNNTEALFSIIYEITKKNMKDMYNESNFLKRGWSSRKKLKELRSDKCKLILGFKRIDNVKGNGARSSHDEGKQPDFLHVVKSNDKQEMDMYLSKHQLICFVHYRLTPDYYPYEKNIVCYLYEIQIVHEYTKMGIGKHLMDMLVNLCRSIKLNKIICTVLKKNVYALSFYKKKCAFQLDESSPDNFASDGEPPCEYEILKRQI
ncbi:acetyltransferase, GNAT family, putative [Plasmodium ovale]|uniref:N-alpha-acetyltransferase 40 n=2 Tax=Plasmodium ovale TaxID=36330 RepID=A0A1A8W2L1_PLAOA|nr:acetyltransferase, GNAT family, putative [Plasmodium ovale curtisi]SBS96557.1 acetyltransferase, GNAT family, putative [Plasmodium ovale curtisi]SCP05527.1 acetyltransferase, GNAT family, putative [Plasmodium ovale]